MKPEKSLQGSRISKGESDILDNETELSEINVNTVPQPKADKANAPPDAYKLEPDGIYFNTVKDGRADWVWLCSPLRVVALTRASDSKGWGHLVELTDPDGRTHRWSIPSRLFAGDHAEIRAELLDMGIQINSASWAKQGLSGLLQDWRPTTRAITTERLGWTDETCKAFVLGSGKVIGPEDEEVVFQSENAPAAAAAMHPKGTLEEWRNTVGAACIDNPIMMLAVSHSLAGSLLEPMQMEGGGLHLRGASSRGKSTVLRAAVSVWGSPQFLQTWRATSNGLEGTAVACNGSLFALDEMGEVDAREAGAAAYMLANGQGKARASRSGIARTSARWRTAILSSGEVSLADKMAEAGHRAKAGQEVRLLDIVADSQQFGAFDALHDQTDPAAFANQITRMAAAAYGTAGTAFVEHLLSNMDKAIRQTRESIDMFNKVVGDRFQLATDGQTSRAIGRFGLVAASGELATAWGITGWQPEMAMQAALEGVRLWLEGRGGGGPREAKEAVHRVRAFISAHGQSRFEDLESTENRTIHNRAGWKTRDRFLVSADAWREIHAGSDGKRAAQYLLEEGYLEEGDGRNLTQKTPSAVPNRPRAYAVKAEILGAVDD